MDGEITGAELRALLEGDGDVRVVDIRDPRAFERGHIPGSECVPFARLPERVEQFAGADRVVTVCPHGEASVRAARLLAAYEGIDEDARVESLSCGVTGWDGPLETGEGDDDGETAPSGGADAPF